MTGLESTTWILLAIVAVVAGGMGWLLATLRHQHRITELSTRLSVEHDQQAKAVGELERTFAALSSQALKSSNESFLQLAEQALRRFYTQAQGDLQNREKAIENLVKPIREALDKTEHQMREMEKDRREAYGSLTRHLESLAQTQQLLHGETRNLVTALRRPEVRGQWGELTLKRLVELAGMVEHCDFYEQEHTDTPEGRMRPDMIVRMPDGREIVVDVKTPLDAYLSAIEAPDDESRKRFLEQHGRKVRERVRELAAKAYWNQFKHSPDFVVLFIPGDQFLSAALDVDRALLEDALRQKIILTTPTSFVALLRAIAYGWRQEALAANAENIREAGEELYSRLANFAEHLARLGKSLDSAVESYNRSVGSFEARVLPAARKFTEMGISEGKTLVEPAQIEKGTREVERET